jgi:hypothetical protein
LSKYPEVIANYIRIQKQLEPSILHVEVVENSRQLAEDILAFRKCPAYINPEPYKGKNSNKQLEYTQACQRVFNYSLIKYATDYNKIVWAATLLRKELAKNWA